MPTQSQSLKQQTAKGVMWRILEVGGRQVVQLVITMVLARLILPTQFGAIAMLSVFLSLSGVFVDSGFGQALVRNQNRTQLDCNSIFYFNIAVSLICYGILYFTAPWVSDFYAMPELTSLLRVMAVVIIIQAFSAVQSALYSAKLNFKILAKYNVLSLILSGAVGMSLAYQGWQAWALVAQSIANYTLTGFFLWLKSDWRPSLSFSFPVLKQYFSFGSKLLASALLNQIYNDAYTIVIGKIYKAKDLAFYDRANKLRSLSSSMPTGVLQSVTYPALCKVQDDDTRLESAYRQLLRVSAFVVFPLCLGVGAVSYPLVNVLFSNTWIYAATLLPIICFSGMWFPIHAINLNLLLVKGRSELFLRLEIIKKIICIVILIATLPFGLVVMCYGQILSSILCLVVNTYYTGKLLNLGFFVQLKDMLPMLLLSMAMFLLCKFLSDLLGDGLLSLLISASAGILFYIGLSKIFRLTELNTLINLLRKKA